jgi:hypothetical protein
MTIYCVLMWCFYFTLPFKPAKKKLLFFRVLFEFPFRFLFSKPNLDVVVVVECHIMRNRVKVMAGLEAGPETS